MIFPTQSEATNEALQLAPPAGVGVGRQSGVGRRTKESVMSKPEQASLETDPRFPSGPWNGFFLQPLIPGRHLMELHLTFCQCEIKGEGRDWVGKFVIRGKYTLPDSRCHWAKRYIGKHDVFYQGFNEGKGIWGKWEILPGHGQVYQHGGFHIWPEGMPDPTGSYLTEAAEEPIPMAETIENAEPVAEPVGADLWRPHPKSERDDHCDGSRAVSNSHLRFLRPLTTQLSSGGRAARQHHESVSLLVALLGLLGFVWSLLAVLEPFVNDWGIGW